MTHKLDVPTLTKLIDEAFRNRATYGQRFGQALWNILPLSSVDYLVKEGIDFYHWTDGSIDKIIDLVYEHLLED